MENQDIVQIVVRCQKGHAESFEKLVDIYSQRLWGYFYRLTANRTEAEELLGELFLKLVRKIKTFKGDNFDRWIFAVASNLFRDYLRKSQVQKKMIDAKIRDGAADTDAPSTNAEKQIVGLLEVALEKIDKETAEIIMLRYYSQLSFKEIAETKELPIGTVLSKVHRGLKKLRQLIEQEK